MGRPAETDELVGRVLAAAARVHAAQAELATLLAELGGGEKWHGAGIQSLGHWADINLGISSRAAGRMATAGAKLAAMPALRAAFVEGAVSLEKVLAIVPVATPARDAGLTHLARHGSMAQLHRICKELRKLDDPDDPDAHERRRCRRGVNVARADDGLVRIVAVLEPDDAAAVLAALDARVEDAWRRDRPRDDAAPPTELSVRRADALVELATEGLVEGPDPVVRGERVEIRVHVDAEVLAGTRPDGLCCIEGVGAVAPSIVRRLLCDARVSMVSEQLDGVFNQGRAQRTVNRRQRRALARRDRGCRFPGCRMQRFVDAHHAVPWEAGGSTDMDNLLLLCPAHHRLFHEGAYGITVLGGGDFTFHRPDGRVIAPPPLRAEPGADPPPGGDPRAQSGGERFDLSMAIDGLISADPAA